MVEPTVKVATPVALLDTELVALPRPFVLSRTLLMLK